MAVRVLRIIEYTYDSVERMEQDQINWTVNMAVDGMTMRSVSLPVTSILPDPDVESAFPDRRFWITPKGEEALRESAP